ncbi:hypothetical protein H0E87_001936 [Populus deltoides]|uniref:Uncharacterized protein n=1 Tax=Populus deltoides TaxID=3696 RepID=A0A8T2ZTR1_POPDE|nr:hypothetical protein H0E87_001936 [Populus deltoides]
MCNAIDGAPEGTSILVRTAAGLNASIFGNHSCHDVYQFKKGKLAWPWQTRTEIVIPMGAGGNDTMFQASPFNLTEYKETCIEVFGIAPRPLDPNSIWWPSSCIAECTMRGCYVKNLQKQDSGSSIQTNSRIICGHMDRGAMK